MREFWNKQRNNETLEDISEENEQKSKGNSRCEDIIIKDKERFGRVRKSTMQDLREEYGKEIANRALWRVSKRNSRYSLQENNSFFQNSNQQDLEQLLSLLSSLDTSKGRHFS